MSSLVLLQIVFNLLLGLGIYILWLRLKKPPQDDPRLSRGLQLLQTKISVLEDLSDRTELQVKQLILLLEQKGRQVQTKIEAAHRQVHSVEQSIERSREMAQIFQDKIPHSEIIERQNTIKYVRAARMANEGKSLSEISQQVDLPMGEIEFIAKINKDQLMFDHQALPEWARDSKSQEDLSIEQKEQTKDEGLLSDGAEDFEFRDKSLLGAFEGSESDYDSLTKLGSDFRQACRDFEVQQVEEEKKLNESHGLIDVARKVTDQLKTKASAMLYEKNSEDEFRELEEGKSLNSEEMPEPSDRETKTSQISHSFELSGAEGVREKAQEPVIIMPEEPIGSGLGRDSSQQSFKLTSEEVSLKEVGQSQFDVSNENETEKKEEKDQIRKVAFPKIGVTKHLG